MASKDMMDEDAHSFEPFLFASISITGAVGIFGLCICILAFYHLFVKDSSEWINKCNKYLTIISLIAFTLATIGDCIHLCFITLHLLKELQTVHDFEKVNIISETTIDIVYFSGTIVFYLLLLLRIQIPFNMNKCAFFVLLTMILIFASAATVHCIYHWISFITGQEELWAKGKIYTLIPLSITDFLLNSSMLITFVYKMKQITVNMDTHMSETFKTVNFISNVTVKHIVLWTPAIIANQAFFAVHFYQLFGDEDTGPFMKFCLPLGTRAMQNMASILAIWLVLRINYNKYICLCKYCHVGVAKCCTKATNNESVVLDNPYHQLQNL
eukprot:538635_1